MQTFSFAPPNVGPREGQKNYVFVDEHNRHKRLKVMRACEGCRRRKIKCDAATTNTWPCSACTRLKLHCVPPTVNQEGQEGGPMSDQERMLEYEAYAGMTMQQGMPMGRNMYEPARGGPSIGAYDPGMGVYDMTYMQRANDQAVYQDLSASHLDLSPASYQSAVYPPPQQPPPQKAPPPPPSTAASFYEYEDPISTNLSDALGSLKIQEDGVAPYTKKTNTSAPDIPFQEEPEIKLPPISNTGSIRIPPELMPSEEDALNSFHIFFSEVHPYIPVLNREEFYAQWHNNRGSMSPLLLEAVFACSGRMADDPAQGAQWLALSARHETYFMDEPRISTLQALLLLLKGREAVPKKGYYYRSWRTLKAALSMAKDMELHEHYETHTEGRDCGLKPTECLNRNRIWRSLLIVELMIGAPQGRTDLGVDLDTVDIRPQPENYEVDEFEAQITRQHAYWTSNVKNIRHFLDAYIKIKKEKDWGSNPKFVGVNPIFTKWMEGLPPDLRIQFPTDNSAPFIPSHFVANMHIHYYLGIVMLHRPQLLACKNFATDNQWKLHLDLCYSSSKYICRLQEAILQSYDLSGLQCMQRGINFTIYAVLTCTMIHLIALTSPDPDMNSQAREFFTRHMRVLEQCTSAWPMPEMQSQIDALRVAFSADINRPFELRPSFPYGSPSEPSQQSPPMDSQQTFHNFPDAPTMVYPPHTITPPVSSHPSALSQKSVSPDVKSMGLAPPVPNSMAGMPVDTMGWDPSRIINQWQTAFGSPTMQQGASPPSVGVPMSTPPQTMATSMAAQYTVPYTTNTVMGQVPQSQPQAMAQNYMVQQQPTFVSPRDWQQSVASVYDPEGLKRRWDQRYSMVGSGSGTEQSVKRMR